MIKHRFGVFCGRHPALFVGVFFFLGAWISPFSLIFTPFFFLLLPNNRALFALFIIVSSCVMTNMRVRLPEKGVYVGKMHAEVIDRFHVLYHQKPFWKMTFYVHGFWNEQGDLLLKGVPITIVQESPLYGGKIYAFQVRVQVDEFLGCAPPKNITSLGATWSLVEWRMKMRKWIEKRISSLFDDHDMCELAGACSFGVFKNPSLVSTMRHLGLSHLLAISGFHFGIVSAIAVLLMRWCRFQSAVAMVLLTLYFFVIGPFYSVMRAWIAGMIVLLGSLIYRKTTGLNCLGVALTGILLCDPAAACAMGFQLSFLATAVILLYSPLLQELLRTIFPKRSVDKFAEFSFADQCCVGVLHRIVPLLSILTPVWSVMAVYQLIFLPEVPLMGFIYNLFVPTLFVVAIPLIVLSVTVPFLGPVFAYMAKFPLSAILAIASTATSRGIISGGQISPIIGYAVISGILLSAVLLDEKHATEEWMACL